MTLEGLRVLEEHGQVWRVAGTLALWVDPGTVWLRFRPYLQSSGLKLQNQLFSLGELLGGPHPPGPTPIRVLVESGDFLL